MKWCRTIYHQCNVLDIIFLKQALNGFHGSFCFPLTSKIAWAACCVDETIFGCKCLYSRDEYGASYWIQLLEVSMPSKD